MALYKALAADRKSSHGWGNDFGPWVKNTWYEIEGDLIFGRNGFHCSDDIIYCQYPILVEYIAQVETDGESIIREGGNDQCWERMRVTSIKAWPPSKSALVLDWAEGQCHASWESWFPSEAAIYDMKHYQGQYADMLEVIEPVWRGMFTNNETIPAHSLHRTKGVHELLPGYTQVQEPVVRLAYVLALVLTGTLTFRGAASWVKYAENIHPGAWDIVKGNAEDYWAGLEEIE